jgi:hypothetical protein
MDSKKFVEWTKSIFSSNRTNRKFMIWIDDECYLVTFKEYQKLLKDNKQ